MTQPSRADQLNQIESVIQANIATLLQRDNPPQQWDFRLKDLAHEAGVTKMSTFYQYNPYAYLRSNYPSISKPKQGYIRVDVQQYAANQLEGNNEQ